MTFTIDDLTRILREGSGAPEDVDLASDILDLTFEDLGYDSLAMLETASRVEREFGVTLEDSTVIDADTPRTFLAAVNTLIPLPTR
ncbi:acyl carrier protein [Nocardia sp. SYP-A9097]|uniref:acyl carrier protein n=1 Tax=Nocardia sp. SYP-A9097 TaxID=2663237 RepID=UPI00129A6290|nr:acyl carrier protein [Nocardia sp. SYP-A9097]MRH90104.1 acyl carrier protein [Nocardia sp. SYP-A9097]